MQVQDEIKKEQAELDEQMKFELESGGGLSEEQEKVYENLLKVGKSHGLNEDLLRYKYGKSVSGMRKLYLEVFPNVGSNTYSKFIKENGLQQSMETKQAIIDKYERMKIDFRNYKLFKLAEEFGINVDDFNTNILKGGELTEIDRERIQNYHKEYAQNKHKTLNSLHDMVGGLKKGYLFGKLSKHEKNMTLQGTKGNAELTEEQKEKFRNYWLTKNGTWGDYELEKVISGEESADEIYGIPQTYAELTQKLAEKGLFNGKPEEQLAKLGIVSDKSATNSQSKPSAQGFTTSPKNNNTTPVVQSTPSSQATPVVQPPKNNPVVSSTGGSLDVSSFAQAIEQLKTAISSLKGEITGKFTIEPKGKLEQLVSIDPKQLVTGGNFSAVGKQATQNQTPSPTA